MKKYMYMLILLSPLLLVVVFAVVFMVYISFSAIFEKDKLYYFPQVELYLKLYKPAFSSYGYVLLSKDSVFSFSENVDFVKIYKSETSDVELIINPAEDNKVYFTDYSNNVQEINQINYIMEKVDWENNIFHEKRIIEGVRAASLKYPYFGITIEGYLNSVFFANHGEVYLNKAQPIR